MAKILVADDNSNIQKMVGLALKDQGIDVVAVGNGEAAVRKIADVRPDLVLADVFMPVRNGYEVCRFVKEDPNFAHIPVILLVGAFDPLDEQEAQRVGADGVLKKPFVPPDPLISMVKSALARAGVLMGAAAHAEKPPETAARPAAELLNPTVSSKIATLAPEKIAEVAPEPIDDFPTPPEQVRIAAGHEPIAFGNLLETPVEDDPAFLPKGRGEMEERSWGVEETEEEEVAEEDEPPRGGWRKDGRGDALDDPEETSSGVSDWREAAFHGESPAASIKSSRWTPAVEEPSYAQATHSPAAAVSTLDEKSAVVPAPFSGDAWAAAMAAGVEEKLAQAQEAVEQSKESRSLAEPAAEVQEAAATVPEQRQAAPAEEVVKVTESSNGWYSVSSSPWDAEAKKASLLAATWDVPSEESAPAFPVHPAPAVEEATVPAAEDESHYAGSPTETVVGHHKSFAEHKEQAEVVRAPQAYEETRIETHEEAPATEVEVVRAAESWQPTETFRTEEAPVAQAHEQEAPPTTDTKSWENTREAGASRPAEKFADEPQESTPAVPEEYIADAQHEPAVAEAIHEAVPDAENATEPAARSAEPEAARPDMDALIARVLEKMNPEVLQKMTHEFLRPVIAAIIQDELKSKNS